MITNSRTYSAPPIGVLLLSCVFLLCVGDGAHGSTVPEQFFRLFGSWSVDSVAAYAAVSALTERETDQVMGSVIGYAPDLLVVGGRRHTQPTFSFKLWSDDDLWRELRVDVNELACFSQTFLAIGIEAAGLSASDLGSFILVSEDAQVYVFWRGVMFRMVRDDSKV